MSYHIYTTNAVVLSHTDTGERDQRIVLFTEELGLLHAQAKSTRTPQSKLRGHLQDFSLTRVSLVRGKGMWRIIGATASENVFWNAKGDTTRLQIIGNIIRLVERLVQGEEEHKILFFILRDGVTFIAEEDDELVQHAELIVVLRILHALGYVNGGSSSEIFLEESPLSAELCAQMAAYQKETLIHINKAIKVSQL